MRHLSSGMTKADSLIERNGAKPNFPLVIQLVPVPESHMVSLTWVVANGLLEGKVLLATKEFERAHRRVIFL